MTREEASSLLAKEGKNNPLTELLQIVVYTLDLQLCQMDPTKMETSLDWGQVPESSAAVLILADRAFHAGKIQESEQMLRKVEERCYSRKSKSTQVNDLNHRLLLAEVL